jgi:hypothetical protein
MSTNGGEMPMLENKHNLDKFPSASYSGMDLDGESKFSYRYVNCRLHRIQPCGQQGYRARLEVMSKDGSPTGKLFFLWMSQFFTVCAPQRFPIRDNGVLDLSQPIYVCIACNPVNSRQVILPYGAYFTEPVNHRGDMFISVEDVITLDSVAPGIDPWPAYVVHPVGGDVPNLEEQLKKNPPQFKIGDQQQLKDVNKEADVKSNPRVGKVSGEIKIAEDIAASINAPEPEVSKNYYYPSPTKCNSTFILLVDSVVERHVRDVEKMPAGDSNSFKMYREAGHAANVESFKVPLTALTTEYFKLKAVLGVCKDPTQRCPLIIIEMLKEIAFSALTAAAVLAEDR